MIKMPKRRKPLISGEGCHFLKSKKTPRIENTNRKPENLCTRRHLEESKIATVTKQDEEENSQTDIRMQKLVIQGARVLFEVTLAEMNIITILETERNLPNHLEGSVNEITNGPIKEPRQPEKDPFPIPRPQMFPESNDQKAENVQFDEPVVEAIQEDKDLEDQKEKDFLIPHMDSVDAERVLLFQEHDSQSSLKPTDGNYYNTAGAFNKTPQEMGSISPVQERTNKEHLLEGMTNTLNGKNPESKNLESGSLVEMEMNSSPVYGNLAVGNQSQKEALLNSNASITGQNRPLLDRRATHKGDMAQEEVGTSATYGLIGGLDSDDFLEEQGKREESNLAIIPSDSNLSAAGKQSTDKQNTWDNATEQECPDNVPQSNRMNQNAKLSHARQGSGMSTQEYLNYSCPTATDLKGITHISESKGRVQLINGNTEMSSFSNRNPSVKVLLEGAPYAEKDRKDREEAKHEGDPTEGIKVVSNHSVSIGLAPKDFVPKIEYKDTIVLALEKENLYPEGEEKHVTASTDQEEVNQLLGTKVRLPWLMDFVDGKESGLDISERSEQNLSLEESSLPVSTAYLFKEKEMVADPAKETETNMESKKFPSVEKTSLTESGCNYEDHTDWGESLALELDFLPDSQIRDALDDPNFGFPSEQASPVKSMLVPSLPSKKPHPDEEQRSSEAPLTLKSTSSHSKLQPRDEMVEGICDPPQEDATAIICGLTVELSNLNRLIMSTHRDLESFRRLKHRKGKTTGKQPPYHFSYPLKGATQCPPAVKKWKDK
ncbi:break repair meiotic recombinase recruitment factor 1 isoform X2 [Monodelphis domestica]|uniref:break repair meiotic recombinase recruitment factor 1 isoform X2 n=1 Tax=Monodelphis domestica TaxID=13616 RepID=UPI0004431710|nr:break repair meiotic recombinase recruitment factor 1 isoform X2 [Monodelphis domestica]